MILCDASLRTLLPKLIKEPDYSLINPASVDIRIGKSMLLEYRTGSELNGMEAAWRSAPLDEITSYCLMPREFVLVETYEHIMVPNGYAVELKLKSSMARQGFNHSLAFWIDPGWDGILTMEITNVTRYHTLKLIYGMRFAQIIVHRLDQDAHEPYNGRYQHAGGVQNARPQ